MPSILIAEDDTHIRTGLIDLFESENFEVAAAQDGEEAITLFDNASYDLILLDIMMPKMSGYDVCRSIRKKDDNIPIIMLTAKGEEIDKVVGLQLGADDYVTKPFGVHELLARVEARLRRATPSPAPELNTVSQFTFGSAIVNVRNHTITLNSQSEKISTRELDLLHYFMKHPEEVLSRDDLLNQVWGVDYLGTTRTLDQHISQLRKKVETDPSNPQTIITAHGVGYKYIP